MIEIWPNKSLEPTAAPVAALMGLVLICSIFVGCISDRIGSQVAEAVVTKAFLPPLELANSAKAFRQSTQRWPKNYREFSDFEKKSGSATSAKQYNQIDFQEKPNGSLEIYAVAPGVTNRMTLTVEETER